MIVRESLYNFHKTGDVKGGLNIGIRAKISSWLDEMGVENYTINDDYSIDVDGNVDLENKGLKEFPEFINFGKIGGYFTCSINSLKNLKGCPREVGSSFYCYSNNLTSLDGAPKKVVGNFNIYDNPKHFTRKEVREVCDVSGLIY